MEYGKWKKWVDKNVKEWLDGKWKKQVVEDGSSVMEEKESN